MYGKELLVHKNNNYYINKWAYLWWANDLYQIEIIHGGKTQENADERKL